MDEVSKLPKILLSNAVMALVLFVLKDWYFIPVVVVASSVYIGMLVALRVFGDQERELLTRVLAR